MFFFFLNRKLNKKYGVSQLEIEFKDGKKKSPSIHIYLFLFFG